MTTSEYFPCPCCSSIEFSEQGSYEICEVCGWEDDPVQSENPNYSGGANKLSLNEYRTNFLYSEYKMLFTEKPKLVTKKAKSHWIDVDYYIDTLCGPLSHIAEGGDCQYIFKDNDYWKDINTIDQLESWFNIQLYSLNDILNSFDAKNNIEVVDKEMMLNQVLPFDLLVKCSLHSLKNSQ